MSMRGHDDNALLERLLRRATAPLGVIDTRPACRTVERWRAWQERHHGLSTRLLARQGADDDTASKAPTVSVWRASELEPGVVASTAPALHAEASARPVAPHVDGPAASDPPSYRLRRMPADVLARETTARAAATQRSPMPASPAPPLADASSDAPTDVPADVPVVSRPRAAATAQTRAARDGHRVAGAPLVDATRVPPPAPRPERPMAPQPASTLEPRASLAQHAALVDAHAVATPRAALVREQPRSSAGKTAPRRDTTPPFASSAVLTTSSAQPHRAAAAAPTTAAGAATATSAAPSPVIAASAMSNTATPPVAEHTAARRDIPTHQLVDRVARVVLRRLSIDLERRGGKPWR